MLDVFRLVSSGSLLQARLRHDQTRASSLCDDKARSTDDVILTVIDMRSDVNVVVDGRPWWEVIGFLKSGPALRRQDHMTRTTQAVATNREFWHAPMHAQ